MQIKGFAVEVCGAIAIVVVEDGCDQMGIDTRAMAVAFGKGLCERGQALEPDVEVRPFVAVVTSSHPLKPPM